MKFYYVHDYEFDWEVFPNAFDIINYTDEMNQTLDSKKSKVETHWNSENTSWKVSQLIDKNVNIKYGGIPHTVRTMPFIKELEDLPIEYKNISDVNDDDGVYIYIVDLHGRCQHFLQPIEEEAEDNPSSKQSYRNEGVGKISKKALNYLQNNKNF